MCVDVANLTCRRTRMCETKFYDRALKGSKSDLKHKNYRSNIFLISNDRFLMSNGF